MSEVSFPGDGQDGEQPPPAGPARDGTAGMSRGGRAGEGWAPARPADGRRGDGPHGAASVPEDDWDPDAEMAAYIADLDAGRARIPEEWELECRPAAIISLGDAADVDLAELAVMLGPDGLGGEVFAAGRPAGVMRPGPVLAALTEGAVADPARLGDNQLLGAISAARRLAARAEYLELQAVAEFTRRREAQVAAARARKVPAGRRPGEFADAELAMELVTSPNAARDTMEVAGDLEARLPATRAALAAGVIDGYRARIIWRYTRFLTDADAATADALLAEAAPRLRYDRLARKALAAAMRLDPEAMTRGRDLARKDRQRVTAFREDSGNAALAGRELAIGDALASKAHIDALAAALGKGGLAGSLRELRVLAFLDLTQGRDPLDRLTQARDDAQDDYRDPGDPDDYSGDEAGDDYRDPGDPDDYPGDEAGDPDAGDFPGDSAASYRDAGDYEDGFPGGDNADGYPGEDTDDYRDGDEDGDDGEDDEGGGGGRGPGSGAPGPGGPAGRPVPFPALINLVVPAGTLFGWSTTPGEAGGWGLTDHDDTRALVQAASLHPRTRWCLTLTGPDGTATAHGCARGPRPWIPPPPPAPAEPAGPEPGKAASAGGTRDGPGRGRPAREGGSRDGPGPPGTTTTRTITASQPDARQAAALAALLRELNVTLTPIAQRTCDHRNAEDRYIPSRKLKHLVRARTVTCPAPGCGAQAHCNDLDHTVPHPAGSTDECNLSPPCRRHHRAKQAPGWQLSQPEPGVMRWQTPSGRVYTTRPAVYET